MQIAEAQEYHGHRFPMGHTDKMEWVPKNLWPEGWNKHKHPPSIVYLSAHFLALIYPDDNYTRISICRTSRMEDQSDWQDNISWEEIQKIKSECGYGQMDAMEIYPRDSDVVNVANLRHIWVSKKPIPCAWRKIDKDNHSALFVESQINAGKL